MPLYSDQSQFFLAARLHPSPFFKHCRIITQPSILLLFFWSSILQSCKHLKAPNHSPRFPNISQHTTFTYNLPTPTVPCAALFCFDKLAQLFNSTTQLQSGFLIIITPSNCPISFHPQATKPFPPSSFLLPAVSEAEPHRSLHI